MTLGIMKLETMTRTLRSLLLTACAYVHLQCYSCLGCTNSEVIECIKPLQPYGRLEESSVIFPYYSDSSLDKICRFYNEMEVCLRGVREGCNIADRSHYEGLEAGTRFLCEDGQDEYRQHRDCFTRQEVSEVGHTCNRSFINNLNAVGQDETTTLKQKKSKVCSCMTEKISCLKDEVGKVCGRQAGSWLHTMEYKKMKPTLDRMGCFKKTELGIPAIFGIMLGIFTVVMIVILSIVVCQKRRGNTSLRAVKPRSRTKPPPKKKKKKDKKNSACATQMAVRSNTSNLNRTRESLDVPSQKLDASFVEGQSEVSYLASTAQMNATVTDGDTECTTYVVSETH